MMLNKVEMHYVERGMKGDELLDVLDVVEDLLKRGVEVRENGTAILYHATNPTSAEQILKEQAMFGEEDGLFFSTSPHHQISGYGSVILAVEVPVHKLILDDEFSTEQHYRITVRPMVKKKLRVCLYS